MSGGPLLGWRPALVATDLDGTLLGSDGEVSAANLSALAAVAAAGVPYVVVGSAMALDGPSVAPASRAGLGNPG